MVNRIVVGAHYGLTDWLVQRISAVVMTAYVVALTLFFMCSGPISYVEWKALFANGWMKAASLLFTVSVLAHAWIGIRDILMDYVKHTGLRLMMQVLFILWLIVCGGWALQILWRS